MYLNTAANKGRYARWNAYVPDGNDESVYLADPVVAHLPGVRGKVAQEAADGAARAASTLAAHRDTGNSQIRLERGGGPDWLVSLVDPDQEDGGLKALAIEGTTGALASAFPIPKVDKPDIRRDKAGRFLGRQNRDERGRFTGRGGD